MSDDLPHQGHISPVLGMRPGPFPLLGQCPVCRRLSLPPAIDLLIGIDLALAAIVDTDRINQLTLLERPYRLHQTCIGLIVLRLLYKPA